MPSAVEGVEKWWLSNMAGEVKKAKKGKGKGEGEGEGKGKGKGEDQVGKGW